MESQSGSDAGSGLNSDIDTRTGWPDELRVLLRDHPRETWAASTSQMVQFWIEKHGYLRRQSMALMQAADEFRASRISSLQFGAWIAPRLQGFLAELHGHHQVEDYHYFPAFRAADPRLEAGFDVLARDHERLHEGIAHIVESVNAFITTLQNAESGAANADAQRLAADRYIEAAGLMHTRIHRHLEDEEDLIIPLMLARHA